MSDTKVIEARCTRCSIILKKVRKRPIKKYNWRCDGCGARYPIQPGFEFYSCKKCRMDWCYKQQCLARVEETKIIPRKVDNSIIFNTSFDQSSKKRKGSDAKSGTLYSKLSSNVRSSKDHVIDDFSSADGIS